MMQTTKMLPFFLGLTMSLFQLHFSMPARAQGNTATVTGSGKITEPNGTIDSFSFGAIRDSDGSVSGQMQFVRHPDGVGLDIRAHFDITCLVIQGNEATIIGSTKTSNIPGVPEGFPVFFSVQDNGEGNDDLPDQMSGPFVFDADDDQSCRFIILPRLPVEKGNIQVRVDE